ncbi:MAG: adenylyl-sulfate kinase [Acidobacteriota bacterium]
MTATELSKEAAGLETIQLTEAQACDFELLATGALAPRTAFDASLPLMSAREFASGTRLALRDGFNERLAILTVNACGPAGAGFALQGGIEVIRRPRWRGFDSLRMTPADVRQTYGPSVGWLPQPWPTLEEALRAQTLARESLLPIVLFVPTHLPAQLSLLARVRAAKAAAAAVNGHVVILPLASAALLPEVLENYGAVQHVDPGGAGSLPEVDAIRSAEEPSRSAQGFCLWFTGLPSSGKSTVASEVAVMLEERGRRFTFLDGDVVRTHLSKGLGFNREDRDTNILRIGWVASEIVRHRGVAICAAVSPYEATRERVRAMMASGQFILVHIATPAEVCETRDVKGFYAQARAGTITGFTGVDDPYEIPVRPDLRLETGATTPRQNAEVVVHYLVQQGFC